MTSNNSPQPPPSPDEDPIRHHVFDGIQEFDRRLPNWWLLTFYGAIIFAIVYWIATQHFPASTPTSRLEGELAKIEAARLASSSANLDDASIWKMSRNPVFVAAGKATFDTTCASCHLASLKGKTENPAAVGPDLVDAIWLHGGKPTEVLKTVNDGVLAKGMPAWGPVLGSKKVSEVVAYIMSHHEAPQ